MKNTMRVYITNLGKYNEGFLVGEWVNLPATENEIKAVLDRIGIDGVQYEEYFITDYESSIDSLKIWEFDQIKELNEVAESLENLDEYELEIFSALVNHGYRPKYALETIDDCMIYYDCYSMTDVAERYADEVGLLNEIPESLRYYFDFEAFGRDLEIEGNFYFTNNGNCVQVL